MTFSSAEIREEHHAATTGIRAGNNGVLPKSMYKGCEFSEIRQLKKGNDNFVIKRKLGTILKKRIQEKPGELMKDQVEEITK